MRRYLLTIAAWLIATGLAQEAVTLSITVEDERLASLSAAAARYEAANPHSINGLAYEISLDITEAPTEPQQRKQAYGLALETGNGVSDIYALDVVLAAELAIYFADLYDLGFSEDAAMHFPATIGALELNEQLAAFPWIMDAGLLYYRNDLLAAYGFTSPPANWDELQQMARVLQAGERRTQADFWGYLWQGNLHEPLSSNALEWFHSNGAGSFVNDEQIITVNSQQAVQSLLRAKSWLGTVSPLALLAHDKQDSLTLWQAGNAAFMRNSYFFEVAFESDTRIAPLPAGNIDAAASLASQHLAIAKSSEHAALAADFIRFLSSPEEQKTNALTYQHLPTSPALYKDIELTLAIPYLGALEQAFNRTVYAPAIATGSEHERANRLFARAVHNVLTNQASPQEALRLLELDLVDLTGFTVE